MFDDITYLKLFVSPEEPWEEMLRQLRTRRITKAELQKRIAFTVVNGKLGKVGANKGDSWLMAGDTFAAYNSRDWVSEYSKIKLQDTEIVEIRAQLLLIPYLSIESIREVAFAIPIIKWLDEYWNMSAEAIDEEISLYGVTMLEKFKKERHYFPFKQRGRFFFVRALHDFIREKGYDAVAWKRDDCEWMAKVAPDYAEKTQEHYPVSDSENDL